VPGSLHQGPERTFTSWLLIMLSTRPSVACGDRRDAPPSGPPCAGLQLMQYLCQIGTAAVVGDMVDMSGRAALDVGVYSFQSVECVLVLGARVFSGGDPGLEHDVKKGTET
jgi:hypothetical protein